MRDHIARAAVRLLGAPLAVRSPAPRPADAAAVLGAPTAGDRLSVIGEERVRAGVEIWRRGLAPLVIFSGASGEATVMAAHARELGLPERAIRLETTARSTRENARGIASLLPAGSRVWIATQPFHLRRAGLWFRRAGLEPLPWRVEDSVQFRYPRRALRWIAREYAAWAALPFRGSRPPD